AGGGRIGRRGRGRRATVELHEQGAQFESREQATERVVVGRLARQVVERERQREVGANGRELWRHLHRAEACAQVLAHLAADIGCVGDQLVQRLVLPQPLGRGLGSNLF